MKKIGIYNPYLETKGGGEKVCTALAAHFAKDKQNQVYLITYQEIDLKAIGDYFAVDLSNVRQLVIKADNLFLKFISHLPLPSMAKSFFFDLAYLRKLKMQNFDLFINNLVFSNLPSPVPNGVYLCMFPQKLALAKDISTAKKIYMVVMTGLYRITMHPRAKYGVQTYRQIIANSEFTQEHIKQRWGLDSTILYPICENMQLPKPPAKEKIILNVGRFFARDEGNHHKRQDMLLDEFAKMTDLHKAGWQLHFAGSVAEDKAALKYIIELTQKAKKLPVVFHFNCAFKELKEIFNQAGIYWHATGYGSDPNAFPERQEHFGITTVEAMSTGAIPVVLNSAGQRETVQNDKTGYLWSTPKELDALTRKVANMDSRQLAALRLAVKTSAKQFDHAAFEKQANAIFGPYLAE